MKTQKKEPPNKTKSLGNVHPPPKSTGLQNGMCCSLEQLQTLEMIKVQEVKAKCIYPRKFNFVHLVSFL